jgi:hypothetical protein
MAGWFLDPETVQSDALEVQEARESRLVVSDQIKAERQEAILARVIEREFTQEARRRWSRRFAEMAWIFEATDRSEHAAIAAAGAAAFGTARPRSRITRSCGRSRSVRSSWRPKSPRAAPRRRRESQA